MSSKTMHLTVAAHEIAKTDLPTIAILTNSVAASALLAVTGIMRKVELKVEIDWQTPLRDAIAQLRDVKEATLSTQAAISEVTDDVEEAMDVKPVITNLIDLDYLQPESPVVVLLEQGLEATFTQLLNLFDEAEQQLVFMEDVVDTGVNSDYLANTQPTLIAVDHMKAFANDLLVIIEATWRAHKGQPSFVPADKRQASTGQQPARAERELATA